MKARRSRLFCLLFFSALFVSACGLLAEQTPPPGTEAIFTQAAQTIQVQLTQTGLQTAIAQLTQVAVTPLPPTETLGPIQPTQAHTPTPTPVPPTPTYTPTPTPEPIPCNLAQFVDDVAVEDGAVFTPGTPFTKIWRIKNVGSCTWDPGYDLIFVSGNQLNGRAATPLPGHVQPGQAIDLWVDLQAPEQEGRYRGFWMLQDGSGQVFGIGAAGDAAFWVDVRVVIPSNSSYSYDFAANYCDSVWRSAAGRISCSDTSESEQGAVLLLQSPQLENGRSEDELTLWTIPENTAGGWITGRFPAYLVKAGDHFLADVGCLAGSRGCDVTFSVHYQLNDQPVRSFGDWRETFDGNITRIDIDLSFLSGNYVEFILEVTNNGDPGQANAFWLVPSIQAIGSIPGDGSPAVQAARQNVASALGVDINSVGVLNAEAVQWSDSCLGIHLPGQSCSAVLIPGYRVILTSGGRQYEAHTNQDGSTVFWVEI